jgi:hypothetical protein
MIYTQPSMAPNTHKSIESDDFFMYIGFILD